MRRALYVLAAVLAVFIVVSGGWNLLDLAARDTRVERASYDGVRALRVRGSDVVLTGAPAGGRVEVTARITEGLRSPDHEGRVHDGTLELDATCPAMFSSVCSVRYEIAVPEGLRVQIDVGDGDVRLSDVRSRAAVDVATADGDVSATGLEAPALRVRSADGDLRFDELRVATIDVRSADGDVDLDADDPLRSLAVRTADGDVRAVVPDLPYVFSAETADGDVDSSRVKTDPSAPRRIDIRTSDGDVRVQPR